MFEELESFNADQWAKVGSKLKDWITSKRIMIRDLYIKSYESDNTNNYIFEIGNQSIINQIKLNMNIRLSNGTVINMLIG